MKICNLYQDFCGIFEKFLSLNRLVRLHQLLYLHQAFLLHRWVLLVTPPSTKSLPSISTGENKEEMRAGHHSLSQTPLFNKTSFPVSISVAMHKRNWQFIKVPYMPYVPCNST
jgi:hypothetical protein